MRLPREPGPLLALPGLAATRFWFAFGRTGSSAPRRPGGATSKSSRAAFVAGHLPAPSAHLRTAPARPPPALASARAAVTRTLCCETKSDSRAPWQRLTPTAPRAAPAPARRRGRLSRGGAAARYAEPPSRAGRAAEERASPSRAAAAAPWPGAARGGCVWGGFVFLGGGGD